MGSERGIRAFAPSAPAAAQLSVSGTPVSAIAKEPAVVIKRGTNRCPKLSTQGLVLIDCFQMFNKSAQDFRGLMTINVEFFCGKGGHASDASSPRSLPILVHFWTVKTMPQCFFGPFVIERKILRNLGQNLYRTNISIVNKVSREKGVVDTINCIRFGVSPSSASIL